MRTSHLLVVTLAVIIVGISVVYLLTQPPSSVKTASTSTASATNSMPITASTAGVPSSTPITASPTATTQSASRGVLSTYPVTITDSAGRNITLEKPARRIVAHTIAVWVLAALNATDRVVGTSMRSFREDPAFMKVLPKDVADVGSFFGSGARVNVELIVSLNPDVVIAPIFYPESELEAKLPPHVKVVRLDFNDVKRLAQEMRTLGVIVNKTAEAEELVKKVERLLKLVKERVANATSRPKVYLEWHSPYSTPARGSDWHEFIELAGGVNVFSDLEVQGLRSTVQVSPEGVVQRAPDVIVKNVPSSVYNPCAARNATALARLRAEIAGRPGWSSIPAVASNRTYVVSNVYNAGYGTAVHLVLLAKLIHPELFADIDVDELINDLLRTMGIDRYCTGARVWVYPPLDHKPPPLRTAPSYPAVIIDAWNRTVILERPAKRVVTHNNYAAWVLAALNATELIVGVGDNLDPLTQKVIRREVPLVGRWNAPSVEKILALNPDVVIFHDVPAVETFLSKIPPNVKVVVLSLVGDPETVMKEVRIIGLIINKTDAAERLISKYEKLLEQIKSMLQRTPREKVRVYFEFFYPNLNALAGGHPTFNKIIEMAGGVNIFGHVPQRAISVSPETVIALDPDVVIGRVSFVTTRYNPCLNDTTSLMRFYKNIIESRPGWDKMRAVKQERMYILSNEYLQALGTVAMVGYLAKAFYPETFRGFDPNLIMTEWLRDMGIEKYCRGARVWLYPS